MKKILLLIAVLFVSACATTPTMKSVAGAYEDKDGEDTRRLGLLENGVAEFYVNDKKEGKGKWRMVNEKVHVVTVNGMVLIFVLAPRGI